MGTDKIIALSENGAIPDIDSIAEDKAYWSYWMTWSQTWSGNFLDKTPTDMWVRNLNDERIIALDDMPGWDNVKVGIPKRKITNGDASVTNKLDIAVINKTLTLHLPQYGRGSVALFDMQGHQIATLVSGNITAGTKRFDLQSIASGSYLVRVNLHGMNKMQRVTLK